LILIMQAFQADPGQLFNHEKDLPLWLGLLRLKSRSFGQKPSL